MRLIILLMSIAILTILMFSCTVKPAVSPEAFQAGMERFSELSQDTLIETEYLVIVDFSQASDTKRMQVHNLRSGENQFHLVAHGEGNGIRYADTFSNDHGSHQSSLGFFRVGSEYSGDHGRSLYLFGLDDSLNNNAYDRFIVLHAADYVSRWTILVNKLTGNGSRIGRSWGCFAVPNREINQIVDDLQENGYIYAWDETLRRD